MTFCRVLTGAGRRADLQARSLFEPGARQLIVSATEALETNMASGTRTELIKARTADGKIIHVQATMLGGEEDVAGGVMSFDGVADALQEVSKIIAITISSVKPEKASVEFGLEIAVESGKLTAMLVKGSGTASLKVKLEWQSSHA
jgi:hypothetical protein